MLQTKVQAFKESGSNEAVTRASEIEEKQI